MLIAQLWPQIYNITQQKHLPFIKCFPAEYRPRLDHRPVSGATPSTCRVYRPPRESRDAHLRSQTAATQHAPLCTWRPPPPRCTYPSGRGRTAGTTRSPCSARRRRTAGTSHTGHPAVPRYNGLARTVWVQWFRVTGSDCTAQVQRLWFNVSGSGQRIRLGDSSSVTRFDGSDSIVHV